MGKLRFIALSGTVSVTENLYVYETDDKMLIVDCGVGFPDIEMHGVDLVIPDFSYIVKNKHNARDYLHDKHIQRCSPQCPPPSLQMVRYRLRSEFDQRFLINWERLF